MVSEFLLVFQAVSAIFTVFKAEVEVYMSINYAMRDAKHCSQSLGWNLSRTSNSNKIYNVYSINDIEHHELETSPILIFSIFSFRMF